MSLYVALFITCIGNWTQSANYRMIASILVWSGNSFHGNTDWAISHLNACHHIPIKHVTLTQWWFNAGPPSATLAKRLHKHLVNVLSLMFPYASKSVIRSDGFSFILPCKPKVSVHFTSEQILPLAHRQSSIVHFLSETLFLRHTLVYGYLPGLHCTLQTFEQFRDTIYITNIAVKQIEPSIPQHFSRSSHRHLKVETDWAIGYIEHKDRSSHRNLEV